MVERRRRKRRTREGQTVSLEEVIFGIRITAEDGKVEVCGGGGCLFLFGMFFMLFGCGSIVLAIHEVDDVILRVVFLLISTLFALVGALLAFGRYRLEIDAYSRTYRRGYSLLLFFEKTRGSLDAFDTVTLAREVSQIPDTDGMSRGRFKTFYPIRLSGPQGTLHIASRSILEQARNEAEKVAKVLNLRLADRTGRQVVVREPDHLDESLRERRRRTGERLGELPPPPEGMQTQLRIEGDEIILEIPPPGLTGGAVFRVAAAVLFVSFVVTFFMRPLLAELKKAPDALTYIFIGFLSLFFILLPLSLSVGSFLRALRASSTLRVSRDRLCLKTRGVIFSEVCDIPADELEELQVQEGDVDESSSHKEEIVAHSDRTTVSFGRHLPHEEKQWIKAVIEHVVGV